MAVIFLSAGCPNPVYNRTVVPVTGVILNKTSTSIQVGCTEQLTATVNPPNAANKSVTWSSSAENIAKVSTSGLVTAVAQGNAVITVTTEDGGYTATCSVSVPSPDSAHISGLQTIYPSDPTPDYNFGAAVAISGNKAIVGATQGFYSHNVATDGLAYFFYWNGSSGWRSRRFP